MDWFTGVIVYVLIWWIGLFAVLPFFARPVAEPDANTGWRGAPATVRVGRIVLVNTLVAAMLWAGSDLLISSDWLSFRHGVLAMGN
jgi:predicted secreted protein